VAREAHDPVLRVFLENLFTPDVPAYFIFMLLGLLAGGQVGLIEGGSHDFVRAIEKRYRDLGGEITYRATVEEILVENEGPGPAVRAGDRAVGVRLAGGGEHRADYVVSAADGYSTIFKMLGGRYANDKIRKRYAGWKRFTPLLMASYGVAREFLDEPPFGTLVLDRPLTIGTQEVPGLFIRIFNYSQRFAPPGKTVIQAEFETEWHYWNKLQERDRAGYDAEKARVAAEVLDRLERYYPGLSAQVEVTDVSTPYTTWRYTQNDRGAWEGWLMTPKTMMTSIERSLPGLKGFFMAGQWVMPGGGVPPCLYSGQHAVQLLCHEDGRRFVSSSAG
jgi:phytoene dehydrogenase-like protein